MTLSAPLIIALALGLLLFFSVWRKNDPHRSFRSIRAFQQLKRSIELSVEDGSRMQISIGRGGLLGPQSAASFAGLTLLRQVTELAADSDQSPLATTGDGSLMLLAQDIMRISYRRLGIRDQYRPELAQIAGLTPFSYAVGTLPFILGRSVSASALVGNFGSEVGLISTTGLRSETFTLGGSDNLSTQALLFASANEPLIGEELYASGAYLNAGSAHQASLRAQDVLRWLTILLILVTALAPLVQSLR